MAKKQVKRWYVRRVAKFDLPIGSFVPLRSIQRVAITHEGLKALEQDKKGAK